MRFTPFPSTLVRISARNAAAHHAARVRPGDHEIDGIAAYRMADGKVRLAYDPYRPDFPEGAEPGLARASYGLRHYANETSGYVSSASGFLGVADLALGGMRVDQTCAGIAKRDGTAVLVVTESERDMAELADVLAAEGIDLHRAVIVTDGLGETDDLNVFCACRAPASFEIRGAPDLETLTGSLRRRYGFVDPGETPEEFLSNLMTSPGPANWDVCLGGRDNGPRLEQAFGLRLEARPETDPEPF